MNTETGELIRLRNGQAAPAGFTELQGDEAEQANDILGDRDSVVLPRSHPLRKQVTKRTKNKMAKASRKRNRR